MNNNIEIQYTITGNITDHRGYKGQPVFKFITHSNGYFTMSDKNGNQWYCGEEELTELPQRKEESPTVPLWRRLNELRTKEEWLFIDRTLYALHNSGMFRKGVPELCNRFSAGFSPDYGRGITNEECEANAQYTALAVNNLHILAEALEKILKENYHTPEQYMSEQEIKIHNIAKEALKAIS